MFMISVSTLFGYHLYLIARNRSTLGKFTDWNPVLGQTDLFGFRSYSRFLDRAFHRSLVSGPLSRLFSVPIFRAICLCGQSKHIITHISKPYYSFYIEESYKKTMFFDGVDASGFNLGLKENFKQVFGDRILHAFLPIFTRYERSMIFHIHSETFLTL